MVLVRDIIVRTGPIKCKTTHLLLLFIFAFFGYATQVLQMKALFLSPTPTFHLSFPCLLLQIRCKILNPCGEGKGYGVKKGPYATSNLRLIIIRFIILTAVECDQCKKICKAQIFSVTISESLIEIYQQKNNKKKLSWIGGKQKRITLVIELKV